MKKDSFEKIIGDRGLFTKFIKFLREDERVEEQDLNNITTVLTGFSYYVNTFWYHVRDAEDIKNQIDMLWFNTENKREEIMERFKNYDTMLSCDGTLTIIKEFLITKEY